MSVLEFQVNLLCMTKIFAQKKLCLVTASRKLYKKKLAHTIVALW